MRMMNEWKAKQAAKDEAESLKKERDKAPSPQKYGDIEESGASSSYQSSNTKPITVA